jgi:glycosyltransferase involved in cell wall biosynthesis
MPGDLVSAVIPSYNYGRFVAEAVASVLGQTYPHVEVIVVDDGSTDDTPQRLEPFGTRIRYLRQENQGLSGARNTGIRAARGPFVALLDADDVWHPRKLEVQMRYLGAHPEVGLVGSDLFTDRREHWPAVGEASGLEAVPLGLDDVVGRCHFAPSSAVIRRACLDEVGLFDPGLRCVEDREMWIRFVRRFRIAKLPVPLLWYRTHGASLSARAARMEESELRVLRRAFAEVPELRGRPLFRLKTFSYAAYNSAYAYGAARQWLPALRRLLHSMLLWPVPYRRAEADGYCDRLRKLAVLLLRMAGLVPPEPAPDADLAAPLRKALPASPA